MGPERVEARHGKLGRKGITHPQSWRDRLMVSLDLNDLLGVVWVAVAVPMEEEVVVRLAALSPSLALSLSTNSKVSFMWRNSQRDLYFLGYYVDLVIRSCPISRWA